MNTGKTEAANKWRRTSQRRKRRRRRNH